MRVLSCRQREIKTGVCRWCAAQNVPLTLFRLSQSVAKGATVYLDKAYFRRRLSIIRARIDQLPRCLEKSPAACNIIKGGVSNSIKNPFCVWARTLSSVTTLIDYGCRVTMRQQYPFAGEGQ